jgi:hypothetical protein
MFQFGPNQKWPNVCMYHIYFTGNRPLRFACLPADREMSGKEDTDKWFRDLLESEMKEAGIFSSVHCKEEF